MFCPFRAHNLSTDCVGPECMWYVCEQEKCAMLVLVEDNEQSKKIVIDTIDLGEGVVYSEQNLANK